VSGEQCRSEQEEQDCRSRNERQHNPDGHEHGNEQPLQYALPSGFAAALLLGLLMVNLKPLPNRQLSKPSPATLQLRQLARGKGWMGHGVSRCTNDAQPSDGSGVFCPAFRIASTASRHQFDEGALVFGAVGEVAVAEVVELRTAQGVRDAHQ
jgi:hypothetical protein